jgi:hypothetical protein
MKTRIGFATLLVVAMLMPFAAMSQNAVHPSWPNQKVVSVYVVSSSEAIPAFPHELSGYRSEDGKDFWNEPFPVRGTMRVSQGNGWQGIPKFPSTMNGCSSGVL